MSTSVSVRTLSGKVTYYVNEISTNFRAWNDSVGDKFKEKAEKAINNFNKNYETVWNRISKFPDVDPKDFEYKSMRDKIERLGV